MVLEVRSLLAESFVYINDRVVLFTAQGLVRMRTVRAPLHSMWIHVGEKSAKLYIVHDQLSSPFSKIAIIPVLL